MRLKRLHIHGFKTFADKTEIQFAPDITAIVGPNGSGKSNITDAVLWALGEQKVSSLRAAKAQDVIFAGSAKRRATGVAEVTLTLDNEDGTLPLQFAEVTVTRRLYRSGEGEYFLNRVPCRLKDITDLFLDTGVGRDAYAIVNQSQIDAVLSARAEERRELFEEAAGIKRYRNRRRETHRKLENTDANLHRVRDILAELETQRAPLAAQAEKAKHGYALTHTLRQIEVAQLAQDWRRVSQEQTAQQGGAGALADAMAQAEAQEIAGEAALRHLRDRLHGVEQAREANRQALSLAQNERNAAQNARQLGEERQKNARREAETLQSDLLALAADLDRIRAAQSADSEAAERLAGDLATKVEARDEAEAEAKTVESELRALTQEILGLEADDRAERRRRDALQAEAAQVETRRANRQRELTAAQARADDADAAAQKARLASEQEAASAAHADAQFQTAQARHLASLEPARLAHADLAALSESRARRERDLAGDAARLRVLEETEAAHEGYFVGVRNVLRGAEQGRLRGEYRTVADSIAVPGYLDTAVETALGGALQDIITPTQTEAKAAIAFLNETRSGRATFLPLDSLRAPDVPDALRRAAKEDGMLGVGADLVGHDPAVSAAVRVLLARVLFVETLDDATRATRNLPGCWAKIVTLGGEVIVPSGAMTGGAQARQNANLLGRKREIGELSDHVRQTQEALARLREDEARARESVKIAEDEVRDALGQANQARDAQMRAQRQAQTAHADHERQTRNAELMRERWQTLRETEERDAARVGEIQSALADAPVMSQSAKPSLLARQEEINRRRDAAQSHLREQEREIAQLRERRAGLLRDGERNRQSAERIASQMHDRQEKSKRVEEESDQWGRDEAVHAAQWAKAQEQIGSLSEVASRLLGDANALQAEAASIETEMNGRRRAVQQKQSELQALRLRIARLEAQTEAARERLWTTYEVTPQDALAFVGDVPVGRETASEIGRLRRALKELGDFNPNAIEEFAKLTERLTFLTDQKDDLQNARAQLLSTIGELDEETKGVFLQTFHAVGKAFGTLFAQLFGGGETQLVLTQPENLLETGVDIIAQPPGKKRQNLALLSGGERALTATALLFAFLQVRPAPFCILDEVDAPLDGANVEKFSDMLRDMAQSTQFIIITHNAATMEAAPLWYGVTMPEPGVSRGLSMRAPVGGAAGA